MSASRFWKIESEDLPRLIAIRRRLLGVEIDQDVAQVEGHQRIVAPPHPHAGRILDALARARTLDDLQVVGLHRWRPGRAYRGP